MFRTLIYPSSGARDCVVELPHRSSCSQFVVCWRFGAAGFGWCSFCRLKHNLCFSLQQGHYSKPSHTKSPTHNELNKMTDVVIQQHSRKLLMMAILMSETCWVHKKWHIIASDIKFVFYSSTICYVLWQFQREHEVQQRLNKSVPWISSWARWIQSTYLYHTSLRYILMSSHLCQLLPSGLIPLGFPRETLCLSQFFH